MLMGLFLEALLRGRLDYGEKVPKVHCDQEGVWRMCLGTKSKVP